VTLRASLGDARLHERESLVAAAAAVTRAELLGAEEAAAEASHRYTRLKQRADRLQSALERKAGELVGRKAQLVRSRDDALQQRVQLAEALRHKAREVEALQAERAECCQRRKHAQVRLRELRGSHGHRQRGAARARLGLHHLHAEEDERDSVTWLTRAPPFGRRTGRFEQERLPKCFCGLSLRNDYAVGLRMARALCVLALPMLSSHSEQSRFHGSGLSGVLQPDKRMTRVPRGPLQFSRDSRWVSIGPLQFNWDSRWVPGPAGPCGACDGGDDRGGLGGGAGGRRLLGARQPPPALRFGEGVGRCTGGA
jgi:hypothetical protein